VTTARRPLGWVLLLALVVLVAVAAALVVADLIAQPRDRWAALLFAAGTLVGVTLDRAGSRFATRSEGRRDG